jgi:hypothetical protein
LNQISKERSGVVTGWLVEFLIIGSYARNAGMMGLVYVYAEIGAISFLSCFRKGDREVPKGGLWLIHSQEMPLRLLPNSLELLSIAMKEAV